MLPQAFLERMQNTLAEEYPDFLKSLERPRAVALRFAPGKQTQLPFVGDNVPWEPLGFYYDPQARPGLHPFHEAGVYYLQEASAMAPVALLDPQPGEWICDLCAAPGGKSTQIAGRMAGQGLLLSNEIHPKRAKVLSHNIERMGISNALVTNESPQKLSARFPNAFHRVLVDAPCSGEGMFRKEEAAVTDWSEDTVAMCARRQLDILHCAAQMVRPGGRLVYSTCTFAPQENEEVVEAFLASHGDFTRVDIAAPWFTPAGKGAFRLWPHKLMGEGHFAAVLCRSGNDRNIPDSIPDRPLPACWHSFRQELGITLPAGKAITFGENLFYVPEDMPSLQGLKVERPGLELGQIKKDRFLPAHALALWLGNCSRTLNLPVHSLELGAYLHGEVIPCTQKGWCLVQADGFAIGWGKGDGVQLKNHYPKGLRR